MEYAKKQINPLIEKYAINPNSNKTFIKIIEMFDGQPNYQVWGIKSVFGKATTLDVLSQIKDWVENNQTLIKKLSKNGNVICYKSASDFRVLISEMNGLSKIQFLKNMINMFNTDQRNIITADSHVDEMDGVTFFKSSLCQRWFNIFEKFNCLPAGTKKTVINRLSSVRDASKLYNLIEESLAKKYSWNKEELLAFVAINTTDTEVFYDSGNIVILKVKTYRDSNKLCYGRTNWCITNSDGQWKNYVTSHSRDQYFLFNFGLPENDECAYIAFTVDDLLGITHAHSKTDKDLKCSKMSYHGKSIGIYDALLEDGVDLSLFHKVRECKNYTFTHDALLDFIYKGPYDLSKSVNVVYDKNNILIINVTTKGALTCLMAHTMMDINQITPNSNTTCFLMFDFNKKDNDMHSIVSLMYEKDSYQMLSFNRGYDSYGIRMSDSSYLSSLGISSTDFINTKGIDPAILLHKMLDENNEIGALKALEGNPELNVNFLLNGRTPLFTAIGNHMYKVIEKILSHPKFSGNSIDSFGMNLLEHLLYIYYCDSSNKLGKDEAEGVHNLINALMDSGKFDLNYVDPQGDTVISIAATSPDMLWIMEKLLSMPDININVRNDINFTALGMAIRNNNKKAIELLCRRDDLIITANDKEMAKKIGVNLDDVVKKERSKSTVSIVNAGPKAEYDYDDIFKRVFA